MKTQKNSRKNLTLYFICIGMMVFFSVNAGPAYSQAGHFSFNFSALLTDIPGEDTVMNDISCDALKYVKGKGPEKGSFKKSMNMIISLFCQPFISRKSIKNGPYDVIIVPGIPYHEDKGAGLIMKLRLLWAHHLIAAGIAQHVIFSGSAVYTPYVESQIMASCAMELGIPASHIFCETRAEHSTENEVYSIRLAQKLGFEKIAVATGPYQSAFLSAYVKDHDLPVSFIPITPFSIGKEDPATFSGIDPSTAFVEGFVSLVDRESKSERFQGTLGNKIVQ